MSLAALADALMALVQSAVPEAQLRLGPPAPASGSGVDIALWLCKVEPDAAARSAPRPGDLRAAPSLSLRLAWLICATGEDQRAALQALGAIASVLADNPLLALTGGEGEGARLALSPLETADLAALWTTLGALPLQPCLALSVSGVSP